MQQAHFENQMSIVNRVGRSAPLITINIGVVYDTEQFAGRGEPRIRDRHDSCLPAEGHYTLPVLTTEPRLEFRPDTCPKERLKLFFNFTAVATVDFLEECLYTVRKVAWEQREFLL